MIRHPSGFPHGPHPKALKTMFLQTKAAVDEHAVMTDTRDPLESGDGAGSVENRACVDGWKTAGA